MMETCPSLEADRPEPVDSDRLQTEVLSEFSTLPELQHSSFKEKEHLQVYLRIRPFTSAESENGESQDCVVIEPPDTVLLKPPSLSLSARLSTERSLLQTGQRFQFSKVYGPETTQRELFEGTVKDLVKDVLEGGNSLVFTYGVTNAGKTFTFLGPDADAGILPRSLEVIFNSIEDQIFTDMSVKPHRCREFSRLSREQQAEEAAFKRNLLRPLKESQRSNVSLLNSTNKTLLEASCMPATSEDKISLQLQTHTKFSVWVSFCEIYNENIHDLLEVAPSGGLKRTALRLSQDVKGDAFVKDLRWVQVSSAEEAYKVMKLGKRNQSFSSTRLNQLSSRSHSIFSIRILRIEDVGTPRVHTVSELSLCDLAGSERCAKTQNKGERLKEAGNINTSLLILGKCINALRHNQQAKLLQHVPFRESKLTHYLQGFFCGRGKACMIVNINQCASIYDETLNVLKFSAVAQKVVVLSSRLLPIMPQRSTCEATFSTERKALRRSRRSSLIGWDSSLEDVQEDEDDECEEESLMDDTMDETRDNEDGGGDENDPTQQRQAALLKRLQMQLKKERAESLLMEARVREEVSREFSELLSAMQNDHDERLAREREILEERAERKLEIFKNLIDKLASTEPGPDPQGKPLDPAELAGMKKAAEAARKSLGSGRGAAARGAGRDQLGVQEQMAHKHSGKGDEERRRPLSELQEAPQGRSMTLKEGGVSPEGERLQEALAALEKERKGREDALAALEYQTVGKEEALASLEEERKAKEEAVAALEETKRSREEALASLREERRVNEEAAAALEAERKAEADAVEAQSREEEEAKLEELRKEVGRLEEEGDGLRQEVQELRVKLEAAERQLAGEAERAERASVQLDLQVQEVQQRTTQIHSLTQEVLGLKQEVLGLKQEVQASAAAGGVCDQLRAEVSELQKSLTEEKQKNDVQRRQMDELQLQLVSEKKPGEEEDEEEETASKGEAEELRAKLQEQEETWRRRLDELESQQRASRDEAEQTRAELQEQTQKEVEELEEKLREHEEASRQQVEELKEKLREQEADSAKLSEELRMKLQEQEEAARLLRTEVEEARLKGSSAEEHLKRLNSDLQAEVASLREKISSMEEAKVSQSKAQEAEPAELKLAELEKASKEREAELQKELQALQRSLKEAQERREDEESQAVQEARRREAERRRELLAVAHEAIAQKDEELEKKAEEIRRLKENAERDSETAKSLNLDLQRTAEETSDLREKLADYKKQVQQVQKEISAMREDERLLRQKLCDAEKAKKQLQSDVAGRERSLQQLRAEQSSETKSDQTLQLYQTACKDLEAKQRVMEDMRLALSEQEETQDQLEQALEEKLQLIQELSTELESLKGLLLLQQDRGNITPRPLEPPSEELAAAKQEAARAQESLKLCAEKQQAERKRWLEEKLSLIGQAKEAEDKRNQEMRRFVEDRERYARQQSQMEALSSQLAEKEQTMEAWRRDRDTLVAALEVQLQKLLKSQAEKDQLIQELRRSDGQPPQENGGGVDGGVDDGGVAALQAALTQKEAEILRLQDELKAATETRTDSNESPAALVGKPQTKETVAMTADTRASVSSQGSSGCPSVLESSEISTENGRTSRFPRPELEISFSPLQPNRVALRRQGEDAAVTVKITRSARKRKSGDMEKSHIFRRSKRRATREEEVEAENRRNTRTKLTPKLTPHQEETSAPAGRHGSPSSVRGRKEGTLQRIGGFLQSSPTLLGSKAKKMMSLVSGRPDADSAASSSSSSSTAKKSRRKLYRPEISSPMDMPSHPIISSEPAEKESEHQLIKRRLRSRMVK